MLAQKPGSSMTTVCKSRSRPAPVGVAVTPAAPGNDVPGAPDPTHTACRKLFTSPARTGSRRSSACCTTDPVARASAACAASKPGAKEWPNPDSLVGLDVAVAALKQGPRGEACYWLLTPKVAEAFQAARLGDQRQLAAA